MSNKVRLVVIGSGIVGCSAAYHLTMLGWRDVLVLDKGALFENDGSTSHAPGGVVALSHSKLMTQLAIYSSDLYATLPQLGDDRNTYNGIGGLEMAISEARWQDLKRLHSAAKGFGAESFLLTPQEMKEKAPLIDEKQIVGGLFAPKGANISGAYVSEGLARAAEATGGAKFVGHTKVTEIEVQDGRVTAVLTDNPEMLRIECEQVLLCANIWAPAISEKFGVSVPLMACEHQYAISTPLPELSYLDRNNPDQELTFPNIRELDSAMYYRQHWDSYGVGSYWHKPLIVNPRDLKKTAMKPFTPEDFTLAWEQAQKIIPALRQADLTTKFNGMFAFSVDGYPIIGQSKVKGFWTAAASWITHAGGVGKSVAEWMTHGETEWDMRQAHIHRFASHQTTRYYIDTICAKNYREVYDIVHPAQPLSEPRNIRLSPFNARLTALKSEFTAFAGLELPNWFEENTRLLEQYNEQIPHRHGWAGQYWSRIQGAEHLATRDNVALFDLTGLSIIEVRGAGALKFVDYLCSNRINKPVGSVVYTTWLTPSGGIKRDLAVARLADDQFWMFVGEGTLPQDVDWVMQHAPTDGSVVVNDISNSYSALGLWGPNARKVLSQATNADVSNDAFPYFTCQWIEIGPTRVLALRVSYAGELGWELHIPMDSSLPVWDKLWDAGREQDMIAAGMGAFDSLRIEKGYRLWGRDIYTEYNPYQAGLGWAVKLKKGPFIGRNACQKAKKKPLKKKLCCITLDDPNAVLFGYEPVFAHGECIGHITSGNYGYSVRKFIAYAYLPAQHAAPGTQLQVEYFAQRIGATVSKEPLYDPKMTRLKA
ncbi:MAG: GcvT family protein [Ardenticatenaceae bacterium]